jgi:beta-glucuronidase
MLYPQSNSYRSLLPCAGFWKFRVDPDQIGEHEGWHHGFDSTVEIAVPGSWNEQLEELGLANYVGTGWYCSTLFIPRSMDGQRIWLRVGSADYEATVWVNGERAGTHRGGFLPFEFEITTAARLGAKNTLAIRISNQLPAGSIPQGITSEDYLRDGRLREETFPPSRFDFFPYGGIHRPILLHSTPPSHLSRIAVDTTIAEPSTGVVHVHVQAAIAGPATVRCSIEGHPEPAEAMVSGPDNTAELELRIQGCRFWSPEDPSLYLLHVALCDETGSIDDYEMQIGVREVAVKDGALLLNRKPIYLKGFGRHEDFAVIGKGLSLPLVVKDFGLMKWIHANSFRTSHYPYAEETMAMADRQGFLVIDEVPAVSLDLRSANAETLIAHKSAIKELIERDYSHPSVIMWALGNEPNLVGEDGYHRGTGREYWKSIFAYARTLDATRPCTVPNCTRAGVSDPVFEFSDVLSLNRYYGWYEYPGRIQHGVSVLGEEMDLLHEKYGKPILMTEFGADTIPGLHSVSDQLFTEEYQESLLEQYIALLRTKPYVVGEHVWNLADFKAPQHFRRVLLNMKGVFTRTRQPKAAAFTLKRLWQPPMSR